MHAPSQDFPLVVPETPAPEAPVAAPPPATASNGFAIAVFLLLVAVFGLLAFAQHAEKHTRVLRDQMDQAK